MPQLVFIYWRMTLSKLKLLVCLSLPTCINKHNMDIQSIQEGTITRSFVLTNIHNIRSRTQTLNHTQLYQSYISCINNVWNLWYSTSSLCKKSDLDSVRGSNSCVIFRQWIAAPCEVRNVTWHKNVYSHNTYLIVQFPNRLVREMVLMTPRSFKKYILSVLV